MAINLNLSKCIVCEIEFPKVNREITCSKKDCREISNMINLRSKLTHGTKKLKTLKELWYYTHIRLNLLEYKDFTTFKSRMEGLRAFEIKSNNFEIAKDYQIISNKLLNKRL